MKLTANIKLNPTPEQYELLKRTLETSNQACNYISQLAWENKKFGQFELHKTTYYDVKSRFNLSAQMTVRSIAKVADAYKLDKKTQRIFKQHSAQPYDDRIFRMMASDLVSIWTLNGRQKIPFQCGNYQRELLKTRKGEIDLMLIKGIFYIACTCDINEDDLINPEDVLGIDLGIVNLAVDSKGRCYSGKRIEKYRKRMARQRQQLQKIGSRSAKRKLKRISRKQNGFQKDVNHCISKTIVTEAKRSCFAIALENLKGIRKGIKARKSGRARLHNWGFYQLKSFIEYKAKRWGIPVIFVDPKHTSQTCPICDSIDRKNRPNRDTFKCCTCGFSQPADNVAALNIRAKALFVNEPMVTRMCANSFLHTIKLQLQAA